MSRIAGKFAEIKGSGRIGLATYLTVGYPDIESTVPLVASLIEGGADIIELGVPFSDPLADGTTIQRASFQALQNGVSIRTCIEAAEKVRQSGMDVPLLFMGYYNPILNYGLDRFCGACEDAGVDGLIIPDLPPEEAFDLKNACQKRSMDLIFLVAPTSTDDRLARVTGAGSGFVYCVSLTGITGARQSLSASLPDFLSRVRKRTELPLGVGFGISKREHLESLAGIADAAIIGSAIIDTIDSNSPERRNAALSQFVKGLVS